MSPPGCRRYRRRTFLTAAIGVASVSSVSQSASAQRRQRWRFHTGGPVFSSPSVFGDSVYIGSQSGAVYAIDTESGERAWRFETDGPVNSSPLIAVLEDTESPESDRKKVVFVGSTDGYLYAIDAESGDELWSFETGGQIQASPVIEDGTVFVTSDHDGIYAVDGTAGTKLWYQKEPSVNLASPTVVGNTLFVRADKLVAVDSQNGWTRWQTEIGSGTYSSPTVADGTVYIGDRESRAGLPDSFGNLYAIDASSGREQWAFETDEFIDSTPTVTTPRGARDAGTAFVGGWQADIGATAEERGGSVHAVDTASGAREWQFETDGRVVSSPTIADRTVFAGSWDQTVYALTATDGAQRWRFETGGKVSSSPVVVDGTVFVGSMDGHLYALDAGVAGSSDGSRVRSRTLGHYRTDDIDTTFVPEGELDTREGLVIGAGGLAGLVSGLALLSRSED